MSSQKQFGKLFLIPSPLGDTAAELVMPAEAIHWLRQLDFLIVEQLRTARRLLSKIAIEKPIDSIRFFELNKHTTDFDIAQYLVPALEGFSMGLLSEAGTPCIADPGAVIVKAAHQLGIKVVPLSGPSSIMMALMGSGFNGQAFCFHGYAPIQPDARNKFIRTIEKSAEMSGQTQIFIETPFRNVQLFEAIVKICNASTMLCIASNISLPDAFISSQNIIWWQKHTPDLHKKPTVFLIWNEKRP